MLTLYYKDIVFVTDLDDEIDAIEQMIEVNNLENIKLKEYNEDKGVGILSDDSIVDIYFFIDHCTIKKEQFNI